MRQGNHSNAKWALAVAALVVLVSGSMVLGSNMGFKFNMPIKAPDSVPNTDPPRGDNWVSIPYLVPYADKQCLCEQLGLPVNTPVRQFVGDSGAFGPSFICGQTVCGGPITPTNEIKEGLNVLVRAVTVGSPPDTTQPVIVVGAHNPSKTNALYCRGGGIGGQLGAADLPRGDNWMSLPYHSTAANRQDICDENAAIIRVSEFEPASGALIAPYLCTQYGGVVPPLNIVKGNSIKIQLSDNHPACAGCGGGNGSCTGAGEVNWTPNHF